MPQKIGLTQLILVQQVTWSEFYIYINLAFLQLLCWLLYWVIFLAFSISLSLGIPCLCSHVTLLLSFSHHQGQKVATCLFITCPRSSGMRSSCKCSCLLATSSLPKSLWTEQPIRANVLVSRKMDDKDKSAYNEQNTWTHMLPGSTTQANLTRRRVQKWKGERAVWEVGNSNHLKSHNNIKHFSRTQNPNTHTHTHTNTRQSLTPPRSIPPPLPSHSITSHTAHQFIRVEAVQVESMGLKR